LAGMRLSSAPSTGLILIFESIVKPASAAPAEPSSDSARPGIRAGYRRALSRWVTPWDFRNCRRVSVESAVGKVEGVPRKPVP